MLRRAVRNALIRRPFTVALASPTGRGPLTLGWKRFSTAEAANAYIAARGSNAMVVIDLRCLE